MTIDAEQIMKRFEALESQHDEWKGIWQKCSDYVQPRLGIDNKSNIHIFDSTAPLALSRFSAAMEAYLTPRTRKWHSLTTGNAELDDVDEVARWLEAVRDIIFDARYAPSANFANQFVENLQSLGVHGTGVIYVDDDPGIGIKYQCIPMSEIFLATDYVGRIDTVFRQYELTTRQALDKFGPNKLPDVIKDEAEKPNMMEKKYEFIHAVFPRKDFDKTKLGATNLPIASVHIAKAARQIVLESGYRTMPYAVGRFSVTSGEVYGRSPAMDVMPAIIQVNEMMKTMIRAAEKMVNPPVMVPEYDILRAIDVRPGSIIYGGIGQDGRQRVMPMQTGGSLPIGLEMIEASRSVINEAYFINLFQVLIEGPSNQSATEVVARQQEKAQLLAPTIGRIENEQLWTINSREVDILAESGAFPEAPPVLMDAGIITEDGSRIRPKYETSVSMTLHGSEGQAVIDGLTILASIGAGNPELTNMVDYKKAGRLAWSAVGATKKVLRTDEEIDEITQAQSQQANQESQAKQGMMMAQGAQSLAQAGRTLSEAQGEAALGGITGTI